MKTSNYEDTVKKIIIIHGYFASPYDHWFPWLQDKMRTVYNLDINVLPMPTPETPSVEEWLATVHENLGIPNKETFIIAHSLGGITLLRYLDTLKESFSLGGMILVSPFDKPLSIFPELDSFVDVNLDYAKLARVVDQKYVIVSDNDTFVSPAITKELSEKLDCALLEIPQGGHFLGAEGFEMFPEVYDVLKKMITKY